MNKNTKNAINYIVIAFICIALLTSSIASVDDYHLDNCHDEDCIRCHIIKIAQTIISLSITFIIFVFIGFLIYFVLSRLHKVEKNFVLVSLVFQKVQLNE